MPLRRIKIKFVAEKAAKKPQNRITVTGLSMRKVDGDWRAVGSPSSTSIPLRTPKNELGIPLSFVESENLWLKQAAANRKRLDEALKKRVTEDAKKLRKSAS